MVSIQSTKLSQKALEISAKKGMAYVIDLKRCPGHYYNVIKNQKGALTLKHRDVVIHQSSVISLIFMILLF